MVRELFHLTKFVTYVGFDPAEAKQDKSHVFEHFRVQHGLDLETKLAAGAAGPAGSSRSTRRNVSKRMDDLALRKASAANASKSSATPAVASSKSKGKQRARDDDDDQAHMQAVPAAASSSPPPATGAKRGRKPKIPNADPSSSTADDAAFNYVESLPQFAARKHAEAMRPLPAVPPPLAPMHPAHVPPARQHASLAEYYSSFALFANADGTETEMSPDELARVEARETNVAARIDAARIDGTMPDGPSVSASTLLRPAKSEPWRANGTPPTPHAALLAAVPPHYSLFRSEARARRSNARKVARMVQSYWSAKSGSGDRERKALERHLKQLAKWTIREVNKQWKLAVSVVRAQKTKQEKALREAAGREQLSRILEQSTRYLGERQVELQRGRAGGREDDDDGASASEAESDAEDTESDVYSLPDDGSDRGGGDGGDDDDEDDGERSIVSEDEDGNGDGDDDGDGDGAIAANATIVELNGDGDEEDRDGDSSPDTNHLSSLMDVSGRARKTNGHANGNGGCGKAHGRDEDDSDADSDDDSARHGALTRMLVDEGGAAKATNGVNGHAKAASTSTTPAVNGHRHQKRDDIDADTSAAPSSPPSPSPSSSSASSSFASASDRSAEDARLEAALRDEYGDEDEDDSDEDAGLLADAELHIDELKRRYGLVSGAGGGDGGGAGGGAEADAEDEDDEEGEHEDEDALTNGAMHTDDAADVNGHTADHADAKSASPSRSSSRSRSPTPSQASYASIRQLGTRHDDDGDDDDAAATPRIAPRLHAPFLLRGNLRPYQQTGFEWLASLYANNANGILADEMGLGKTIQTISVLAHLACDKGVWGPHLVIAPTSVMLNWEVEFKKFLPGFKILSYYGSQRERKEKRKGWNSPHSFNVCITSYQLVISDQHIFRRKPWVYMILDEAHHIKNFRSQRWQTLLGFNSQRRLLLTGTPLQNNLMDLWSLMYFLMPNGLADVPGAGAFANMKDFQEWFSNPLDRAVESGSSSMMDEETRKMVSKLHTILRPFLLRRLKSEVEKELPRKYEHVIRCRLSKRQRFLYNDFMSRAKTRESLASGNYMSIINCLMQLRKVCNHPDLFEVRPINTAFAMREGVVGKFEPQELLVRRRLLQERDADGAVSDGIIMGSARSVSSREHLTPMATILARRLDASDRLPHAGSAATATAAPLDMFSIEGHRRGLEQRRHARDVADWKHRAEVNRLRTAQQPLYGSTLIQELSSAAQDARDRLLPSDSIGQWKPTPRVGPRAVREPPEPWAHSTALHSMVKSYAQRSEDLGDVVDRFAFVPPKAMACDVAQNVIAREAGGGGDVGNDDVREAIVDAAARDVALTAPLQRSATKLQIAFPDASLLQYDCGKLQELERLMRRLKEGSHRILIFTQMTKVLDILEAFLNLHGYRYLRLDGSTRVDRRQALTEKFNRDTRIDAFILSTRSGGLGINLTGADTVLFYDLDWNSAIESQCMDRAHRIGQLRDVHIYRFVSEATVEENMLKKADQKRLLDSVVIQGGEFTTEHLQKGGWRDMLDDGGETLAGVKVGGGDDDVVDEAALAQVEDEEDRMAAQTAREEMRAVGAEEDVEFVEGGEEGAGGSKKQADERGASGTPGVANNGAKGQEVEVADADADAGEEEDGAVDDYMLRWVHTDWPFFNGGGFKA